MDKQSDELRLRLEVGRTRSELACHRARELCEQVDLNRWIASRHMEEARGLRRERPDLPTSRPPDLPTSRRLIPRGSAASH
ncbi:MAG: hypothetical protein JO040_04415 [Gemmatimonadetes bacterium]|nr:hypothetical protein [Gemmatimonadota bacterium]